MEKKAARKKIEKLRKQIRYHNRKYYVEDNPEISDYEYDHLLKELDLDNFQKSTATSTEKLLSRLQ